MFGELAFLSPPRAINSFGDHKPLIRKIKKEIINRNRVLNFRKLFCGNFPENIFTNLEFIN